MSFLLDTNVLGETRRRSPDPRVIAWLKSIRAGELYTSVLVVGEIRRGIDGVRRRDPVQAAGYERWLDEIKRVYGDRIVPVTSEIAEAWGRLSVPNPAPVVDGLLAATALVKGWTLVTRNTKDVERTGVRLINPFEYQG